MIYLFEIYFFRHKKKKNITNETVLYSREDTSCFSLECKPGAIFLLKINNVRMFLHRLKIYKNNFDTCNRILPSQEKL